MSVRLRYVGNDEREIPAARVIVNPGDEFKVGDEIAAGLDGQPMFEKVKQETDAHRKAREKAEAAAAEEQAVADKAAAEAVKRLRAERAKKEGGS